MRHLKRSYYVYLLKAKIRRVPFDMMRYDRAVPNTEMDAKKLERVADGQARDIDYYVQFRVYSSKKLTAAHPRWASFGVEVLDFLPMEGDGAG